MGYFEGMSKLRILAGLLALAAVGAVAYVRASNSSDTSAPAAATDSAANDSCCGPVAPEPIKAAIPASLPSPYSTEPGKDATPAKS